MPDPHVGGKKTKPHWKVHIWRLLHPYITFTSLYQNLHTVYLPLNNVFI